MKLKRRIIMTPDNVIFSYDLIAIDIINQFGAMMVPEHASYLTELLLEAFNSNENNAPLHTLKTVDNKLVLWDNSNGMEATYTSLEKLIAIKPNNITSIFYEKLLEFGYVKYINLVTARFYNKHLEEILKDWTIQILYDNSRWDELQILHSILGYPKDKFIDINDMKSWADREYKSVINDLENCRMNLVLISDNVNSDILISQKLQQVDELIQKTIMIESRILPLNLDSALISKEMLEDSSLNRGRSNIGILRIFNNFL